MRKISIFINNQKFEAELNETETAEKIYESLPIEAGGNFWGEEIYFEIPVKIKNEKPTKNLKIGDLAYWPESNGFCIFYGKTPASVNDEPKPASEVTIIGKIKGNLQELKKLKEAKIKIEVAMNGKFSAPKKVVVGGTFDILHQGHKALLRKAFEIGEVTIGLTSNIMARKTKRREVKDFKYRKKELENFIVKEFAVKPKIIKIEDEFGLTLKEDFNYIVVSPDTYSTAVLINQERQKRNKKPLKIVKIEFVLGKDGEPLSATKLLKY